MKKNIRNRDIIIYKNMRLCDMLNISIEELIQKLFNCEKIEVTT